jgi:hypothetical protein
MSYSRPSSRVPVCLIALPFLFASQLQAASSGPVSTIKPLQTELMLPLDLSHVHVGSPVLVKVALEWTGSGCTLHAGSVVQGHVVAIEKRSKGVKDSTLQLAFDAADCDAHHERVFPFKLVAIVGSEGGNVSPGQSGVSEAPPLADAIGNAIGGPGGIRSARSASAINSSFALPVRQLPAQILPGQVLGVKKTTLTVDLNEKGTTTIKAIGHDVRLEQGTSMILTHEAMSTGAIAKAASGSSSGTGVSELQKGFSMSATGGGGSELVAIGAAKAGKVSASETGAKPVPPPEPLDDTNICTGSCNEVSGPASAEFVQESAATAAVSLKRLGYSPRNNREIRAFDLETVLSYLDAHDLLCAFDPHQLRERSGLDQEDVRKVRAVLIDPDTHSIKRIVEWRVQGDEQYLWRLAEGRILVHMGRELRELDSTLKPVRAIPLDGKLAWVVASPNGEHIAVGVVRERYSEEMRRTLEATLPDGPEESIAVQVFDKNSAILATALQSSKQPPPVLSDAGELRLHGDGHTHWKISEIRWDRTEHPIAATTSACRPLLSTPLAGLIFAVGCTSSGGRWYRMLRPDGHPLLKGESSSEEIQHYAQGTIGGDFAIRTVKAAKAMSYGEPFKKVDLVQERITIYRSQDGSKLATIATSGFRSVAAGLCAFTKW